MTHSQLSELEDGDELGWTLSSALLDAQASSIRALETYLMLMHTDTTDTGELERHLEQTIQEHEQILEDLLLARDAVEHIGALEG
ncbi:MAG: hypothetical protein ABEJ22_00080 [Haloferacaceae archaeon]